MSNSVGTPSAAHSLPAGGQASSTPRRTQIASRREKAGASCSAFGTCGGAADQRHLVELRRGDGRLDARMVLGHDGHADAPERQLLVEAAEQRVVELLAQVGQRMAERGLAYAL